jgi:hypothetical protein
VTPVRDDDLLREHNWVGLENTSVHESYPGHHLQFSLANSFRRFDPARLMNESSVFYEGWALYCEQLMQEEGFLKTKEHRFRHAQGPTVARLENYYRCQNTNRSNDLRRGGGSHGARAHFPRAQACGDLNWYSQSPQCRWDTPSAGRSSIACATRKNTDWEVNLISGFHDKLLSAGSISLPLVERRHFKYEA